MGQLDGRVALITGGGSGVGAAMARQFAAEGALVAISDLRADAAVAAAAALGDLHIGVGGDVSNEEDVGRFVGEVLHRHGRIDILVNNAGISDSFLPTVDQTLSYWQRLIDVHLTGTYLVSKTVAPSMIARRRGAMINLNSIAGGFGASGAHRLQRGQGRHRDDDARTCL